MTWTAVGALNPNANGSSSFSLTPSAVGNLLVVGISQFSNATVTATALSSSNVTWTFIGSVLGTAAGVTNALFIGKVTTAAAATVTITWSGTTPASIINTGQEFNSSVGSWTVDTFSVLNSTGTASWPTLTPAGSGELYAGYVLDVGTAVAGSTSGFTYTVDSSGNGYAYNLNVSAPAAPVWGDAGQSGGVVALIAEGGGAAPAAPEPQNQPGGKTWHKRHRRVQQQILPATPSLTVVAGLATAASQALDNGDGLSVAMTPGLAAGTGAAQAVSAPFFIRIQHNTGSGAGTSFSATLANGVTLGNRLLVTVTFNSSSGSSLVAPSGWGNASSPVLAGGALQVQTVFDNVTAGNAGTTSFAFTCASRNFTWTIEEWQCMYGWPTTSQTESVTNGQNSTANTSVTVGTPATTTNALDLWYGVLAWQGSGQTLGSITAGWTRGDTVSESTTQTAVVFSQGVDTTGSPTLAGTISTAELNMGLFIAFKGGGVLAVTAGLATAAASPLDASEGLSLGLALPVATGAGQGLDNGDGLAMAMTPGLATGISLALDNGDGLSLGWTVVIATGTGAAQAAQSGLSAVAIIATGTSQALDNGDGLKIGITAALATGTGAAQTPENGLSLVSGLASGTGAANAPNTGITPALASGTGASKAPGTGITSALASGTGAAQAAGGGITSGLATGAGASQFTGTGITAGLSTGAGAAKPVSTGVTSVLATGAGTAQATGTGLTPVIATGTGAAQAVSVSTGGQATAATATGTAAALTPGTGITAALATGTGAAQAGQNGLGAAAVIATGGGVAQPVSVAVAGQATAATATGAAAALIPGTGITSGLATGSGTSKPAGTGITAALATGAGAAQTPKTGLGAISVIATGGGLAQVPQNSLGAKAVIATGTGAALAVIRGSAAGLATGAGAAQAPGSGLHVISLLATGAGTAGAVSVTLGRNPENLGGTVVPQFPLGGTLTEEMLGGSISYGSVLGGSAVIASLDNTSGGSAVLVSLDTTSGGTAVSASDVLGGTVTYGNTLGGSVIGWTMQQVNLTLAENNDETIDVAITSSGSPLNLTGATVNMYLKTAAGTPDGAALLLSSAGGSPAITITSTSGGLCVVQIPNMDLYPETYTFFRVDVVFSGLQNTAIYGNISWITL